jgi:hypothetical protein
MPPVSRETCRATIIWTHRYEIVNKDHLEHRAAVHRQLTDDARLLRPATTNTE